MKQLLGPFCLFWGGMGLKRSLTAGGQGTRAAPGSNWGFVEKIKGSCWVFSTYKKKRKSGFQWMQVACVTTTYSPYHPGISSSQVPPSDFCVLAGFNIFVRYELTRRWGLVWSVWGCNTERQESRTVLNSLSIFEMGTSFSFDCFRTVHLNFFSRFWNLQISLRFQVEALGVSHNYVSYFWISYAALCVGQ